MSRVAFYIDFSSNSKLLALDNCGGIIIWDVSTENLLQTSKVDESPKKLWFIQKTHFYLVVKA